MLQGEILSIQVGKPQLMAYSKGEILTGMLKLPVQGELFLSSVNLEGDEQADLNFHGGVDKAVCVYSYEHYPYWEKVLNQKLQVGAFGENLTVKGMLESDVCIGDIFQMGTAVVQVSQPRQPCHKLAKRYDIPELALQVQETGYTGFYFRVLQEGTVRQEKPILLLERDPHGISIQYANHIMHKDRTNLKEAERMLKVEALSANWQRTFTKRLTGTESDPKLRLYG
ncbi:MOSC domain-containing protein [Brevibacillus ginsengisoli]|uniref:MOSC domain-containing protein n=1 Tax=Brevibacillus ginsengisoli TaxID=363854 RepID=UPI003CF08DDD